MFFGAIFLLFLSFLGVFAGKAHRHGLIRPSHQQHYGRLVPRISNNFSKTYTMTDYYHGKNFLTEWDFFTADDPTHGNVQYQSKANAMSKGLAFVQNDGTTVLAVDDKSTLPVGGKRDSVRISTKKTFNGGLFIADIFAMPHGCSVWPAYWSVGPNWPAGGEIDVLEGVHEQPTNQATLHTSPGCTLSTDGNGVSGIALNGQCASGNGSNIGCGFKDTDTRSYGHQFNLIAGGVYAHLWDGSGIKVWHFPRTEIPVDITAKKPNPSSWGKPVAFWSSSSCDMASHFYEHVLVLDTTICGDFAGATYTSAGCPGTCAQAVSDPSTYRWAKWKLNYIAVYQ